MFSALNNWHQCLLFYKINHNDCWLEEADATKLPNLVIIFLPSIKISIFLCIVTTMKMCWSLCQSFYEGGGCQCESNVARVGKGSVCPSQTHSRDKSDLITYLVTWCCVVKVHHYSTVWVQDQELLFLWGCNSLSILPSFPARWCLHSNPSSHRGTATQFLASPAQCPSLIQCSTKMQGSWRTVTRGTIKVTLLTRTWQGKGTRQEE